MCGLIGFWQSQSKFSAEMREVSAQRIAQALEHRGPDDVGNWTDEAVGFAIGQRRLAILDLSAAGHQPMHSANSRWVIAFNGEIYNIWICVPSSSPRPQRCIGMFALALWDRETRILTLARDRFGEKPLYYGWVGSGEDRAFVFGPELKALKAYPGFDNPVCREALAQYLGSVYISAPPVFTKASTSWSRVVC